MPIFFVVAIGTLILDIVDLFLGARLAVLISLLFWALAVLALGQGTDWNPRLRSTVAYLSIAVSAISAIAGTR